MMMNNLATRPKKVLVVDDHVPLTHLWKVLLENTGEYFVQVENDSLAAVEAARRFRPDVLILDMQMPGLDGSEVAAKIRADRQLRGTTIVFMTSLVTQKEVDAGRRIEGCFCLPKPTNRKEMLRVIERSLAEAAHASAPRARRTRLVPARSGLSVACPVSRVA